jgi:hypothetical protein
MHFGICTKLVNRSPSATHRTTTKPEIPFQGDGRIVKDITGTPEVYSDALSPKAADRISQRIDIRKQ